MTLADDLNAPPLARRVAEIIRKHAAELEAGSDWATMAALRVLVEVERERSAEKSPVPPPRIGWIRDEFRRASERANALPDYARPVVTRPFVGRWES